MREQTGLALTLIGSALTWRERVAAAWFGPKGFASVVLGLIVWQSSAPHRQALFHPIALVIALSMTAHSSTDIVMARWLRQVGIQARTAALTARPIARAGNCGLAKTATGSCWQASSSP